MATSDYDFESYSFRPAGLSDSDSGSDNSDDLPRYITRSGWAYRIHFPTVGICEFSFLTSFLVYFVYSFDEQQSIDCYNHEITNSLFVLGNAALNNMLRDFREAGILSNYFPT